MEKFESIAIPARCVNCPSLAMLREREREAAEEVAEFTNIVMDGGVRDLVIEGLIEKDGYDSHQAHDLANRQADLITDESVNLITAHEELRETFVKLGHAMVARCDQGTMTLRGDDEGFRVSAEFCRSDLAGGLSPVIGVLPATLHYDQ